MHNRKKAPAGMYTAKEAIAKLGIPTSSFYNLVRDDEIKKIMLPGRKEAVYSKLEVDRFARAIHSYIDQYNNETVHFGLALTEDIPAIRDLCASTMGGYENTFPKEILEAWIRKNPEVIHILRRGQEIVGYVSMLPLPIDTIYSVLEGKIRPRAIPIDNIQDFVPGKVLTLYVAEAIVNQSLPDKLRVGAKLISETAEFLISLAQQKITVTEMYAIASSQYSIKICKGLGSQELDIPGTSKPNRVLFRLDIGKSKSLLVTDYRQVLESLNVDAGA